MTKVVNRYDFVYLFDVKNGNPNGDPDAGNMPRIDPETSLGLITDVSLKRKVRNYVQMRNDEKPGFEIYVKERAVHNSQNRIVREKILGKEEEKAVKYLPRGEDGDRLTSAMCKKFYDIRTFGAVMTTGVNCGQVRGPVQLAFAQSIDPVLPLDITITRVSVTNEDDIKKERTMGRKNIIPYGLYRVHGFISAKLAQKSGFSEEDLDLFWDALRNMFDHDRSAARGEMNARGLITFKHESEFGNAPAHCLFDLVKTTQTTTETSKPPRQYGDYKDNIKIIEKDVPKNISMNVLLQP